MGGPTSSSASSGGGIATGAGTRVEVTLKLPQLQNLVKRDPQGYREDYDAQVRRLESECGILQLSPQFSISFFTNFVIYTSLEISNKLPNQF